MDSNEAAEVFGLVGGFAGDQELVKAVVSCGETYLSSAKPPLARLVELLGKLPLKARYAFVRKYLAPSPHRDAVLRELFDFCFQQSNTNEDGDAVMADDVQDEEFDEFVLIGNPLTKSFAEISLQDGTTTTAPEPTAPLPLNLNRYHVFQVVIVLMAVSGKAGVEMSRRYLTNSSSTKYRAKILVQCIACFSRDDFSDDELLEQYRISPRSVQDKIVDACKQAKKKNTNKQRKDLLRRIYEEDEDRHPQLLYVLDTEYVATKILNQEGEFQHGLLHWGLHGDAYVKLLRRQMEDRQQDKLQQGKVWSDFERRFVTNNSVQPRHLVEIIKIWEEYQPSLIKRGTPTDAEKFLKRRSAEGEDVRNFIDVQQIDLSGRILGKLSNKEQLALATKYFRARNWESFDMIERRSSAVSRHQLPYKEFFDTIGVDDFWKAKPWDPFLSYFLSGCLIYTGAKGGQEKMNVFQSWSDLMMKVRPSLCELSKPCAGNQGIDKGRWRWWYDHFCTYFRGVDFSRMTAAKASHVEEEARHVQLVLKSAMGAYNEVKDILSPEEAVEPILKLLQNFTYKSCSKSELATSECVRIITKTAMPVIAQLVQLDPSKKTYVTHGSLGRFDGHMSNILKHWGSSVQVLEAASAIVLDLHSRASKKQNGERLVVTEEESPPAPKRRKFVYFNHGLHEQVSERCFDLAKRTLHIAIDATRPVAIDRAVMKQLWGLVRQTALSGSSDSLGVYLEACIGNLPEHLREGERASIIQQSRAYILSKFKKTPHRWKEQCAPVAMQLVKLSLLNSVLDDDTVPKKVKDALLVDHAGFANETARQYLKDQTYVADGDARAEGISSLLSEACKTGSFDFILEALDFAEGRIKNEAGPNRKVVFTWLQNHFVSDIVEKSLKAEDLELSTLDKVCSAIVSILKNDISRLDCVGRHVCFPNLPNLIIKAALEFDNRLPRLEVRRLWICCSIRLHWELETASSGTESLASYFWPCESHEHVMGWRDIKEFMVKSAGWISEEAFNKLYPPSESSKKHAKKPTGVDGLIQKDFDVARAFGPVQCVEMFTAALKEVWSDDIPVRPLLEEGKRFPEKEEVAMALRHRMESLFCLCGPAWQEVETLTKMFDNVFKDIEAAPPSHFAEAQKFLGLFWWIHGEGGATEIPRLTDACDKVFRHAVTTNMRDVVEAWLPRWKDIYTKKDRRKWDMDVDSRVASFVHSCCTRTPGCEPKSWRLAMSKTDEVQRECGLARELLEMSSSALLLDHVRDTLFERRQDVLLHYLGAHSELDGVFKSNHEEQKESIDEVLFARVKEQQLLGCAAAVSRRYAQYALTRATTSRTDLRSRIEAIGEFMSTPSTQPADVLAALQSDLGEAVREALINRVFSLDSPWHILGFLLSQKAIEKNDQRITSALLGYVARHVPLDKVVLVVGHLLKKSRRKKLGFQLHKASIRMLFDANTDVATELLRKEWNYDLHESVRSLLIQKCIERVVNYERTEGWEPSVLMDVASSDSIDVDLKFCLFAPTWAGIQHTDFGTLAIKHPEDVLSDETFDLFRKKDLARVPFGSVAVAGVLRSIMEKLESTSEGSLKLLARLKRLSLSNMFCNGDCDGKVQDDHSARDEMVSILTKPVDWVDHKTQVERRLVSEMFGHVAIKLVNQQLCRRPSMPQSEIEEKCNKMEVTAKLRACVRSQLDAALDLPIRKHILRHIHLDSLGSLLSTIQSSDRDLHQLLVIKPFEKELWILKKDESHITSALRTAR